MLVLTRRKDQKVLFPGLDISIQVLSIKGNTARLGINAPPGIRIVRDDIRHQHPGGSMNFGHACADTDSADQFDTSLAVAKRAIELARQQIQQCQPAQALHSIQRALECLQLCRVGDESNQTNGAAADEPSVNNSADGKTVCESAGGYQLRAMAISLASSVAESRAELGPANDHAAAAPQRHDQSLGWSSLPPSTEMANVR